MADLINRSIANAGSVQSTSTSAGVTFGARLTPSSGCGRPWTVPSSMPSSVATSKAAPEWESRCSSAPAVSRGPIGSVTTPNTGPVSSPASSRNVVAPPTWSPARIAACTGAAPRHAGSREKCRFTQPCAGRSSSGCRISAP